MRRAGTAPAIIHAVMKTGFIISTENQCHFSEEELAEWQAAIDEYDELQRRGTFD